MSRLFGGIHFRSSAEDGLIAGFAVGRYISEEFLLPRNRWVRDSGMVAAP